MESAAVLGLLTGLAMPRAAAAQAVAATAAPAAAEESPQVLAVVDGKPLTRGDVLAAAADDLEAVELEKLQCETKSARRANEVLEGTARQMAEERMFDAEAAQAGKGREEWLAERRQALQAEITDETVDQWYEQNKSRVRGTKEQLAPRIREFLANERLLEEVRAKHQVSYHFEPFRVEVEATGPAKGPAQAPVTIVEFSDFECPYCKRINPAIQQVREHYGDKVRIVFRQFPLSIHANAQKAAEASLCANEQGRFWEMHDLMFEDQKNLGVDSLKQKAITLELDGDRFNQCLDSGQHAETVRSDLRAGAVVGVSGTPALFVNGRFLNGAVPFEQVAAIIDDELAKLGQGAAAQ
jgi:protein-disulfide isomerase